MSVLDFSAPQYLGTQLHTAQSYGSRAPAITSLEADAVIVGSGPGGLTSATVLAESGLKVIVLEAGQFWPRGSFKRKQSWATQHLFQEQGTRLMTGNAFIPLASGRGVGGGTLVNSAICFRGGEEVLDGWVEEWGLDHWERGRREALYEEVEKVLGVAPTPASLAGNNGLVADRGLRQMGVAGHFMPRNAPGCVGCGTCQTGCPSGGKASADLTWLPRVLRAGGQLYADTTMDRIVLEGQRATGVEATMRDPQTGEVIATLKVRAPHVIMACGAINTAMALQHQSLANGSGQVGRNLRVHPSSQVIARFEEDIRLWAGASQGYYARHPTDAAILLETFTAPAEVFVTQAATVGLMDMSAFLRNMRQVAASGTMIRDESSGVVTRGEDGRSRIRYEVKRQDFMRLAEGMRFVAEMFFSAGARDVLPLVAGARFYSSRNEAFDRIRKTDDPSNISLYASHPMGTCRMGADARTAVVRPGDGRTHEVEGLYVHDSSLFPSALGSNVQVTIMAQSLALARGLVARA